MAALAITSATRRCTAASKNGSSRLCGRDAAGSCSSSPDGGIDSPLFVRVPQVRSAIREIQWKGLATTCLHFECDDRGAEPSQSNRCHGDIVPFVPGC